MQNGPRSSQFLRVASHTTRVVVSGVALLGALAAHAQTDDRPVVSGGRAIGVQPSETDDAKPAAERRVTPEGRPVAKDLPRSTGVAPALIFTIDVRWLGATSYRIERDVTQPIERAVKSLPGVKEVHSSSTGSRAQTLVTFSAKEDASTLASAIRNRLDQIKTRLPRTASQPLIGWRREPPV